MVLKYITTLYRLGAKPVKYTYEIMLHETYNVQRREWEGNKSGRQHQPKNVNVRFFP